MVYVDLVTVCTGVHVGVGGERLADEAFPLPVGLLTSLVCIPSSLLWSGYSTVSNRILVEQWVFVVNLQPKAEHPLCWPHWPAG